MAANLSIQEFPASPRLISEAEFNGETPLNPWPLICLVVLCVVVCIAFYQSRKRIVQWSRLLNRQQKIICTATAVFLLVGLFPPWLQTYDRNGNYGAHSRKSAGHAFILSPPATLYAGQGWPEWYGVEIDSSRIAVEWLCVSAAALAVYFCTVRPSKPAPFGNNQVIASQHN